MCGTDLTRGGCKGKRRGSPGPGNAAVVQEIEKLIHPHPRVRTDAAGRLAFLDQCRAVERRAGGERVAVIDRAGERAESFEQDIARAAFRRRSRGTTDRRWLQPDVLARRYAGKPQLPDGRSSLESMRTHVEQKPERIVVGLRPPDSTLTTECDRNHSPRPSPAIYPKSVHAH